VAREELLRLQRVLDQSFAREEVVDLLALLDGVEEVVDVDPDVVEGPVSYSR
jgi:hypothetical protein